MMRRKKNELKKENKSDMRDTEQAKHGAHCPGAGRVSETSGNLGLAIRWAAYADRNDWSTACNAESDTDEDVSP